VDFTARGFSTEVNANGVGCKWRKGSDPHNGHAGRKLAGFIAIIVANDTLAVIACDYFVVNGTRK
jgi:hypothetical protein